MNRRSEVLAATSEAAQLSARFPVGDRLSFDIIGAFRELEIPIRFRRLNKLWGACVTVGNEVRGVLVTTVLDLAVQRFTLAHELGHALLRHDTSLDETVGFAGRLGPKSRPVQEFAADTFASELLASRPLMLAAAKRHRWTREAFSNPVNIYQLALRLGVSYQAACWGLAGQRAIEQSAAKSLQSQSVKQLKLSLAPQELIANPRANVWTLAEADTGSYLEAGPDDIFAIQLSDNSSAGFLWELVDPGTSGQVIDEHTTVPETYGAPTARTVFLRFGAPGVHRLAFEHRRPWSKEGIGFIDIAIDNYGREIGGLPRRVREQALALEYS